jgi:uncharacterized protein (TIGR03067 family)
MKTLAKIGLAAVLLVPANALLVAGGANADGAGELKKWQGTWRYTSVIMEGKAGLQEKLAKRTITFTGDKWAVREDGNLLQAGTLKLDPAKKPAQIDALVSEGPDKGLTMLGIYEIKGDTLKVCFDPMGKARPTSFTPKGGEFATIIERVKKE